MKEQIRFDFIKNRDGIEEARKWALRTMNLYDAWLVSPKSNFTQLPQWRPLFEQSITELGRLRNINK